LIYFIILLIPITLFGIIIGFINRKSKSYIFYGGITGLTLGFSHTFILYYLPKSFEKFNSIITFPSYFLTEFIFNFYKGNSEGNIAFVFAYIFVSTFLLCLIGIFLGFIFYLIKRYLKKWKK